MTDGLRKSHLRKAPQVGLSEVGLPDIYLLLRTKYFLCCHLLVTFARDTEISHLSVRGSEGQDDGRPSSPIMLSFPWGKDKHHLSNNFSHPDYLPESLLF